MKCCVATGNIDFWMVLLCTSMFDFLHVAEEFPHILHMNSKLINNNYSVFIGWVWNLTKIMQRSSILLLIFKLTETQTYQDHQSFQNLR